MIYFSSGFRVQKIIFEFCFGFPKDVNDSPLKQSLLDANTRKRPTLDVDGGSKCLTRALGAGRVLAPVTAGRTLDF